ncbi:ABC transporter ATP-binding protein [Vibrio sp. TRT 21S02]|uniref:ABC transporter ATP-binding protein n=1 Tax=Vibrio sp. TRT 21S02 TaxID=3418507 RepID=UPI003CE906C8
MTPLLKVENLKISSSDQTLVEPISFDVFLNQPLTILGETGAGKSLIAAAITGTLPPELTQQGQIHFKQDKLSKSNCHSKWGKEIALLPQEPWLALDPIMPILQQVAEVHQLINQHKRPAAQSIAINELSNVSLSRDIAKYPFEISGGMAQRVTYLCATQAGGELLLADEPTKGLDSYHRDVIASQLLEHVKSGALITITHDINLAETLGGNIIVMKNGIVEESGVASGVLSNPQSYYTQKLIQATPKHWRKRESHPTHLPLLSVDNVSISRSGNVLFSDLSFTLHQREILGIAGPSGCGKTSLADTLLGLILPDLGDIHWHQNVNKGQKLKLYQDPPSAHPHDVSLQQLLDELCQRHCLNKSEIPVLLKRLKLSSEVLKRSANDVSGGELQRFAILRALMMKPKLLIADEPTSRLDPITSAETLKLLVESIDESQCALIIIGHDEVALEKLCDKVIRFG